MNPPRFPHVDSDSLLRLDRARQIADDVGNLRWTALDHQQAYVAIDHAIAAAEKTGKPHHKDDFRLMTLWAYMVHGVIYTDNPPKKPQPQKD